MTLGTPSASVQRGVVATLRCLVVGAALSLFVSTLGACGGGRASPRETFETIRSAVATGDAARLCDSYDEETKAHRRATIREWRALIARGDDAAPLIGRTELSLADVTTGTVDDVVARIFIRHSPFVREATWFRDAQVTAEESDGPSATKLRLRGLDGTDREVWFVQERGKWALDHGRTWRGF